MWERFPEASVEGYREGGKQYWQLRHPRSGLDVLEFGHSIQQMLDAENKGKDWHRQDAIIMRAVQAAPGLPFAEFISQ